MQASDTEADDVQIAHWVENARGRPLHVVVRRRTPGDRVRTERERDGRAARVARSAGRLELAIRRASVGAGVVSVVTLFTHVHVRDAVSARWRRTIGIARRRSSTLVTGFPRSRVHDPVAAHDVRAVGVARRRTSRNVAFFVRVRVHLSVAASRESAIRVTRRRFASGIALFGRLGRAIAARGTASGASTPAHSSAATPTLASAPTPASAPAHSSTPTPAHSSAASPARAASPSTFPTGFGTRTPARALSAGAGVGVRSATARRDLVVTASHENQGSQ
jgi:hypothetical protein